MAHPVIRFLLAGAAAASRCGSASCPGSSTGIALPAPRPSRAWAIVSGLLLALGLPAGTAFAMRRRHRRLGVDPAAATPATDWATYEPDLPPAVVGVLLDEAAGADEVSATLVDLARRSYVRLGGVKAFWIERLREPVDGIIVKADPQNGIRVR